MRPSPPTAAYGEIEQRLVAWGRQRDDVKVIIVHGSLVRNQGLPSFAQADQWSDLDLYVVVDDTEKVAACADEWIVQLGEVWTYCVGSFPLPGHDGHGEVKISAVFEGALIAEFVLLPTVVIEATIDIIDKPKLYNAQQGSRVLLDKIGFGEILDGAELPPIRHDLPSSAAFESLVKDFWFNSLRLAKKLARGELWMASMGINFTLGHLYLLPMIEWHAGARHGLEYHVWYDGHYLEHWADADVLAGVRRVFAGYNREQAWESLLAAASLFERLSAEVAEHYGFELPQFVSHRALPWLRQLRRDHGV